MGNESNVDAILVVTNEVLSVVSCMEDVTLGYATNLSSQTVSDGSNLSNTNAFEVLNTREDDGIHSFRRVGVLSIGALTKPLHNVEALRHLQWHGIAIESVNNKTCVTLSSEGIGHEFAVLPDSEDVWEV